MPRMARIPGISSRLISLRHPCLARIGKSLLSLSVLRSDFTTLDDNTRDTAPAVSVGAAIVGAHYAVRRGDSRVCFPSVVRSAATQDAKASGVRFERDRTSSEIKRGEFPERRPVRHIEQQAVSPRQDQNSNHRGQSLRLRPRNDRRRAGARPGAAGAEAVQLPKR